MGVKAVVQLELGYRQNQCTFVACKAKQGRSG